MKTKLLNKVKELFKKKSNDPEEIKQNMPQRGLEMKFPGGNGEYVPLGAWQVHKVYNDDLGQHFCLLVDEVAELLQPEGGRDQETKDNNKFKDEITSCLKSETQLGRSSGISVVLATQRNDASLIPGQIQNNCLKESTKVKVLRPVKYAEPNQMNYNKIKKFADNLGVDYNKNGIVFKDKNDKKRFFNQIKDDAKLYDQTMKSKGLSTDLLTNVRNSKTGVITN